MDIHNSIKQFRGLNYGNPSFELRIDRLNNLEK